jgi:hypothetical protein
VAEPGAARPLRQAETKPAPAATQGAQGAQPAATQPTTTVSPAAASIAAAAATEPTDPQLDAAVSSLIGHLVLQGERQARPAELPSAR